MSSITRLRALLSNALSEGPNPGRDQDLFDELMGSKSTLQNLFDVGPRNSQEQRDIESGKITVKGKTLAVNPDFAKQVIFLAGHFNCSERYVASLLHEITTTHPNLDIVQYIEKTIAEFHTRRRDTIDSVLLLLQAAQLAETQDATIYMYLKTFLYEDLIQAKTPKLFVSKITAELDALDVLLAKAETDRRNAKSSTILNDNPPSLGFDILNARYDSIKYERRRLAMTLSPLAQLGLLPTPDFKHLVEWLSNKPNHPLTFYMLNALLSALDPVDPKHSSGASRSLLAEDRDLVSFMTRKLVPETVWKDNGLKSTVLLKWTLFLTEARHRNPTLESNEAFRSEELETKIRNAVTGNAFMYIATVILQIKRMFGHSSVPSLFGGIVLTQEQKEQRESPTEEFQAAILLAFETLVRSLITHASSELRKIKQRQEDIFLASTRERNRTGGLSRLEVEAGTRTDIAILYSLIGLLYTCLPSESALQYWGSGQGDTTRMSYIAFLETTAGKLPAFLQWAVWASSSTDLTVYTSLFDMLSGLSTGPQCSEMAFNFMSRGAGEVIATSGNASSSATVSWRLIFETIGKWGASSRTTAASQPMNYGALGGVPQAPPPPPPPTITPQEVLLAQAMLRLVSTVAICSVDGRSHLAGHPSWKAIPTLVSVVPLSIPLELKGSVFQTLAAFCEPGAGAISTQICSAVWSLMERHEVISVRPSPAIGFTAVKGVEVELENVEASHGLYPATIPFLRLLATLIHTPKRIPLKDRLRDNISLITIPDNLGQPYRLPGIAPYVAFVVDHVFKAIPQRDFAHPSDRWEMNDLCLTFVERCLASFDLHALLAAVESNQLTPAVISPLVIHPGYDILKRLLTSTPFQANILAYVVEGISGLDKGFGVDQPFFHSTLVRVLRIVHRALEIQDIFLDVFVPLLFEFDAASLVGQVHPRSYYTRFDRTLSFSQLHAPALAAYVHYPSVPEFALLSVKILSLLSASTSFSNLREIIESSSESDRIMTGLIHILQIHSSDDVLSAEDLADESTGAGAPDSDETLVLDQAIRLATMDFLIDNVDAKRPYPNVAHFFLFGPGTQYSHPEVKAPHAQGSTITCLHIVLALLNSGVPRLGRPGPKQVPSDPLFLTQPTFAERCYHLIYRLSLNPKTSESTLRYLRTHEDFFTRHLHAIPSKVPEAMESSPIQVLYEDGTRVITTVPTFSAFLQLRSWIFDLVALDLHILSTKGHPRAISDILDILFGYESATEPMDWEEGMARQFQEVGQSHMRIIEFAQSLTFDWAESLTVEPMKLEFLGSLNLASCMRLDGSGSEIIDQAALMTLLTATRRNLLSRDMILTSSHLERLDKETSYVLESCVIENHRRDITHATTVGYESWRRLLDTTLTRCFDRLPHEHRENMLFDLLHILPPILHSAELEDSTAVLISEVILSCITKLREDRGHQIIIQSTNGDPEAGSLPLERLYTILRSILACIINSTRVELVRGNLYTSLINYIHLISLQTSSSPSITDNLFASMSSLATSQREFSPFSDRRSSQNAPSLQLTTMNVIKGSIEKLVVTIARDAIDGTEVWRTVAFMLLDSLVHLSGLEKQHSVLASLLRHGILSNFVQGLKESDYLLQTVLKPDPDDLNPLYVYEAKMSMFVRLAETRQGASRLLDSQIISSLATCDYIDSRPDSDQAFIDNDSFLPSAMQRYHQLFMPTLQLLDAILATLGNKHITAAQHAFDFVSKHGATLVILLKSDLDSVSSSLLAELHLLVNLCTAVFPIVPKSELVSNSGFGAIHSAILALSTRCLGNQKWVGQVQPESEPEALQASVISAGLGSSTKFEIEIIQKERRLRKALVTYIGGASEFTEPEINVTMSPITTTQRQGEQATRYLGSVPSVGDALEALSMCCSDLVNTLRQILNISAELNSQDLIPVENILKQSDIDASFIQTLDLPQKKTVMCRYLQQIQNELTKDTKIILDTTEMLLLVLWRHLEYYLSGHRTIQSTTLTAQAMRLLSAPDPAVFRYEVSRKLVPVLQRIQQTVQTSGEEWNSSSAYVEIMCRRLREMVDQQEQGSGEDDMQR